MHCDFGQLASYNPRIDANGVGILALCTAAGEQEIN